ncbi:MAG: hypothetical protein H0X08_06685 [Blastocatellia bacterium]|nr:hypothetical protein [Blastocatellia bacterium]
MIVRLIAATVAGGIVCFGAGFLIYGLLLGPILIEPNLHKYAGAAGDLMKEPPSMIPLVLANLTFAFLIAFIFERWAGIRTFATGAMAGAIIFFLTTLYVSFSMFAFFRLYKNYTPLLADAAGSIVLGALVGGVIGLILGMMNKNNG